MDCKHINDRLLDLASGTIPDIETQKHLETCSACAEKLASLAQTMALLDDWRAPEPSPYFDTRLKARLREEAAQPVRSWLAWLRKPAMAMALMALISVGVTLYERHPLTETGSQPGSTAEIKAVPGTAVADLQNLDKNHDLYANFDLLDDLDDVTAQ